MENSDPMIDGLPTKKAKFDGEANYRRVRIIADPGKSVTAQLGPLPMPQPNMRTAIGTLFNVTWVDVLAGL